MKLEVFQARGWPVQGKRYQVNKVWQEIMPKASQVPCCSVIWCPLYIPNNSFISWLATLDRLPKKDKIRTWGMLYNLQIRSRDQRPLVCGMCLLQKNLAKDTETWTQEQRRLQAKLKERAFITVVLRLAWNAHVYSIW